MFSVADIAHDIQTVELWFWLEGVGKIVKLPDAHRRRGNLLLPTVQKGHRFLELDSLRGFAAMAVVLEHYRAALGQASPPIYDVITRSFGGGRPAVSLFFILSGFVLTTSYLGPRRPTYPAFLIKRICRLYLPYAGAIILAALLAAHYYSAAPSGNAWIDLTWSQPYSSHLLAQHLIMIGHYDNTRLNTAIWTLIIEMRVALFFPLIAWLAVRLTARSIVAGCFVSTIALGFMAQYSGHELIANTLFYSLWFLAGSLVRRRYHALHAFLLRSSWRTPCAVVVGALCYQTGDVVSLRWLGAPPILDGYAQAWIMAIGAMLILMAATTSNRLRHLLHARVFLWFGARSYSIYLLHGTVLFFLIRRFSIQTMPWPFVGAFLLLVFGASELFYRVVEVPALTLGRKLGGRSVPNQLFESPVRELLSQPSELSWSPPRA